jgi:alpha/beta superfamily hydrolase
VSWGAVVETESGRETPLFFGAPGRRKFAVLHRPPSGAETGAPIVLCAPHFEEKLWAHRVLVDAARRASAAGHAVLRFDVGGHGDSEGEFEDFALDDHAQDVEEAWRYLRDLTGHAPILAGLRLGGTLAAMTAGRVGAAAVLWEPILDLEAWLHEMLRASLTFQIRQFGRVVKTRAQLVADLSAGQTLMLEGYGLTPRFYQQAVAASKWSETSFPSWCPNVLVLSFHGRGVGPSAPLTHAAGRWAASTHCTYRSVDEEAVWSDVRRYRTAMPEVVAATLDWLEGLPPVAAS